MAERVNTDALAAAVTAALKSYSREINAEIKAATKRAAKKARQAVANDSPRRTGDYAAGWRAKVMYDGLDDTRIIIHSPKEYPLTHLLEHGHVGRDGKRVKALPHIEPVEETVVAEFEAEVERIVKG